MAEQTNKRQALNGFQHKCLSMMEHYTKNFNWFEQVVDPAIKLERLPGRSGQFALGYRSASNTEKEFLMKFRMVCPWNSKEVIEITHGYLFSVNEDFNMAQNLKELAGFFAFLVVESLIKVNQTHLSCKIKIPSRRSLTKAIYSMLIAGMN